MLPLVSTGKPGYSFLTSCEGKNPDTRHLEMNSLMVREWEISPRDVEIWDTLLSSVLRSAGPQGTIRLEVLRRVAKEMTSTLYVSSTAAGFSWLTVETRTTCGLDGHLIHSVVSCVELNEAGPFPLEPFALANDWLIKVYPAEELMDTARKEVVLKIFLLIERIVATSPMFCCSPVVLSMSDALCLWIKDANEALSDTEYNETVRYQADLTSGSLF